MYAKDLSLTLAPKDSIFVAEKQDIVVLFADFRGFSNWSERQPLEHVAELMTIQFERVIQVCNDYHHVFHKFLGDGFVLAWEVDDEFSLKDCLGHAIDAAFELHKKYWYFSNSCRFALPEGYGIGISLGEAMRIRPSTIINEMNEIDFVGYPLNCAARMQSLAAGYGTVVCSRTTELLKSSGLLYPEVPGFRRSLKSPPKFMTKVARNKKGLRDHDVSGFRYLTFIGRQSELWNVSGIPLN